MEQRTGVSATGNVVGPADERPKVKRYIPLDVHSYGEGWRITTGWLMVPLLAVITGGLLAMYEASLHRSCTDFNVALSTP
jgi:hypothetical protein